MRYMLSPQRIVNHKKSLLCGVVVLCTYPNMNAFTLLQDLPTPVLFILRCICEDSVGKTNLFYCSKELQNALTSGIS
jgi:hypothetical protein